VKIRPRNSKGSLQDATLELFGRAGLQINVNSRSYFRLHRRSGNRVHV